MIRLLLVLLSLAVTAECAESKAAPVGMHSLEEAQKATDSLFLEASPSLAWRSLDVTGMSEEKVEASRKFWTEGWRKAELRKNHQWTKLMTLSEYREFLVDTRKDSPEWLREKPDIWNIEPEYVLVYYFEMKKEKTSGSGHFCLGLFKRDSSWFFSAQK
jgi:hypothetical protein